MDMKRDFKWMEMRRGETSSCYKTKIRKETKKSNLNAQRILGEKNPLILLNMIRKLHINKEPSFEGKYRKIKQMINNLEALYKPVTVFEWNVRSVVV